MSGEINIYSLTTCKYIALSAVRRNHYLHFKDEKTEAYIAELYSLQECGLEVKLPELKFWLCH